MKIYKILFCVMSVSCLMQAMENNTQSFFFSSECGEILFVQRTIKGGEISYNGYQSQDGKKANLTNAQEIWHKFNDAKSELVRHSNEYANS